MNEMYNAEITSEETIDERKVWVLDLDAKVDDATYEKQKIWVDQERFVPLKQEMFAKSGQLLKRVVLSDVQQIDGRWYPMKMNYKDVLKDGKGTDFIVTSMEFDAEIPEYIFSKAALKQ
jgi:outer membrane lipoprotein-sorting protein